MHSPDLVPVSSACIVDHCIDLAPFLVTEISQGLPIFLLGNICSVEFALELIRRLLTNVLDEVGDDNVRSFFDEFLSNALSETSTSTGDNGNFSFETSWHCVYAYRGLR